MSGLEQFLLMIGLNAYTAPHMIPVCAEVLSRGGIDTEAPDGDPSVIDLDEHDVEQAFARIVREFGSTL